jgi:phosphatidylserine decarboxylase
MPGVEEEGAQVRRGQCLGMKPTEQTRMLLTKYYAGGFRYGGSTVIVVLPKGETVMDEDLVKNSVEEDCETLVQVGWRVGGK